MKRVLVAILWANIALGGLILLSKPPPAPANWTPASWGDLWLWNRADLGITKDSATPPNVSAWQDQSPNAIVFSASATQPTWTASWLNGKPCVDFSASAYVKNVAFGNVFPETAHDFSLWVMGQPRAYSSAPAPFAFKAGGGANDVSSFMAASGAYAFITFGANAASPYGSTRATVAFSTTDGTANYAIGLVRSSGTYQWYSVTTTTTTAASSDDGATFDADYIGNWGNSTGEGFGCEAEIFIAGHAATAGDLTNINSYLHTRYLF